MSQKREVLSIHGGEAGIQLGTTAWELYCFEHGIRPDGKLCSEQDPKNLDTFFSMGPSGKCVPRAIMIDTDSCAIDDVRIGKFRHLYNPKQLISGKEDAANCFAKGYLTVGREMIDAALDRVRISVEDCSFLEGFMIYRAIGGGTGSGMVSYLIEELNNNYPKSRIFEIALYPAPKLSSIIVEPYNAMMATHMGMTTVNCSFVFENDAVYEISNVELGIANPSLQNINQIVSQVLSTVTAQFRFDGERKMNLLEIETNLVPYPRIHFPLIGYSPLLKRNSMQKENFTVNSITNSCFESRNQMVKCNSKAGKYISCCLLYRGDISPAEINSTLATLKMKKSIKFVTWSPSRFKVGLSMIAPLSLPDGDLAQVNKTCVLMATNTAIYSAWEVLNRKFDLMYAKKAFIHSYLSEGLDESDFLETRMDIQALLSDYKEVESDF